MGVQFRVSIYLDVHRVHFSSPKCNCQAKGWSRRFWRDWTSNTWYREREQAKDDRHISDEQVAGQQAGNDRRIIPEHVAMQQTGDDEPVNAERRAVQQTGDHGPVDTEHRVMQLYGPIASSATSPTRPPFIDPLDFGGASEPLIPREIRILTDVERMIDTGPHSLFSTFSLPIDGMEQHAQGLSHAITFGPERDERQLHYEDSKKDNDLHPVTPVQGLDTSSPRHSVNADTHPNPDHLAEDEDESEDETSSLHDGNPPTSDHPSLYEEETSTSGAPVTVRIVKEQLFQEAVRWKHNKSVNLIKKLIRYDKDDDDKIPDLTPEDFSTQRRRYEKHMRTMKRVDPRPFHVYGTKELYDLDRLRLWARLGRNTNPETPFPPGYVPISDASDLASFAGTLYTQETSTTE